MDHRKRKRKKKERKTVPENHPLMLYWLQQSLDCVDQNKLFKILKDTGITDHLICLMRNLYAGQEATVRTGHGTTDCFQIRKVQFSSVAQSSPTLWPHGLQHTTLPCASPIPGACSNSCPLSNWCHPAISSSVFPFSSCLRSFPASGSFPVRQFFASGGQSIGVAASHSVLPMNIQDWFHLGLTGSISLQSKRLTRVFSNTTV